MTWQAWTADGVQVTLTAACTSEIFSKADAVGVIRLQDGNGSICRKIGGEWVWL